MSISNCTSTIPAYENLDIQDSCFTKVFELDKNGKPCHPDFIRDVFSEESQYGKGLQEDALMYLAEIPYEKRAKFPKLDGARFAYALTIAADSLIHGSFEERIDAFLFIIESRQNEDLSETSQSDLSNKIQELNKIFAFDDLDLSNLNLSGMNLSNLRLRFAYMMNSNLSNSDLANTDLTESRMYNADLTNADMTGVILFQTTLEGATMTNTKLNPVKMIRTDLTALQLVGLMREAPSSAC